MVAYSSAELGFDTWSSCTTQDPSGVLYFACGGLATLDGDHWTYTPVPGTYLLRSIVFGRDGRLWAAGAGELGWFTRTPDLRWEFHSLRAFLPKEFAGFDDAWRVFPDAEGATFITSDSILRWNGTSFKGWHKAGTRRLFSGKVGDMVFVQYLPEGLYTMEAGEPRLFISHQILGNAAVLSMERLGDRWLLGTSEGFFTFDGATLTPFAPEVRDFVREHRLTCAARLPDGRLAIGTMTGGIAFLQADGSLDYFLGTNRGIPSAYVGSLFVARDGELWVTSSSHIYRLDLGQASTLYDERSGLPRETYRRIAHMTDRLAVTNDSGVYTLMPGDERFSRVESLGSRWLALRGTERGLLTAGYKGVKYWEPATNATTTVFATERESFAIAPSRFNPGEYFLSDNHSVVAVVPGNVARPVVRQLPDIVTSIEEDHEGQLWLGTYGRGFYSARPAPGTIVDAIPAEGRVGLPALNGPTHVRVTPEGTVLVFAHNGGWSKAPAASRFEPIAHYPQRNVAAVSEVAADGSIWVVHSNSPAQPAAAGRVVVAGSNARWEPHSVHALSHIGAMRSICAEVSPAGETVLWIGGSGTVLRHIVGRTLSAAPPRAPLLRASTRSSSDDIRRPITAALPYSTRSIELEFAIPEFSRRASARLETQIEGVDRSWTPASAGSQRELTAIREGRYTVRVRAVNEAGVASPETVFQFEVLPPWWRTSPAAIGGALALAALGFGFYRMRVRALRGRNTELEAKVRERTEQLEHASAAKTEFVANMSHDIRNPLNGIVGLTLALEDTKLDSQQVELVATLRECTTYLSSLVDDVLDFASIEAGRVELRPGPFVPAELLRSIVTTLKTDTVQSGATFAVEVDPALPPYLLGDAGRIQQILVNYVSNALKYAGGEIRLSAAIPRGVSDEIEFSVTDRGPGIHPAGQATLFTKFTRLSRVSEEEIPGTGLGLAACRLLADIMGGSVGVESQLGHGARFFLRLPLTPTIAPAAPMLHDPAQLVRSTVLLVEDTDYNALAAAAVLRRLGLTCERARTGEEALQMFAAHRFNIVLLDRNLPDMDGTEVARRLRALEADASQAVILAVTAYCTAADRQLCLDAGMDAFVGKPLTPEKLRKVLFGASRRLLASASMEAAPSSEPSSGLDTSLLSYISDGTDEGFREQLERFIATLAAAETRLAECQAARDYPALSIAAHQLLGQARLVGATLLGETCARLEQAAHEADATACEKLLAEIVAEIHRVTAALHRPRSAALTT